MQALALHDAGREINVSKYFYELTAILDREIPTVSHLQAVTLGGPRLIKPEMSKRELVRFALVHNSAYNILIRAIKARLHKSLTKFH